MAKNNGHEDIFSHTNFYFSQKMNLLNKCPRITDQGSLSTYTTKL